MNEQERQQICHTIALDMYTAGLGWHEDTLLRFTAPPIGTIAERAAGWAVFQQLIAGRARCRVRPSRRQKRRVRKARQR